MLGVSGYRRAHEGLVAHGWLLQVLSLCPALDKEEDVQSGVCMVMWRGWCYGQEQPGSVSSWGKREKNPVCTQRAVHGKLATLGGCLLHPWPPVPEGERLHLVLLL